LDRGTVANAFLDRGTVANALAEPQTRKERIVAMVKKLATPLIVTGVLN
jgi:lambda repressor-like predicted transcriptional regulator